MGDVIPNTRFRRRSRAERERFRRRFDRRAFPKAPRRLETGETGVVVPFRRR